MIKKLWQWIFPPVTEPPVFWVEVQNYAEYGELRAWVVVEVFGPYDSSLKARVDQQRIFASRPRSSWENSRLVVKSI